MFTSERVHRAPDTSWPAVEHMRVNHGRLHVLVTKQLLHGADVIAILQRIARKRVPKSVTLCMLHDALSVIPTCYYSFHSC